MHGLAAVALVSLVAPVAAADAPALLAEADAALQSGDLARARALYETLLAQFPQSDEAGLARRSLDALDAAERARAGTPAPATPPVAPPPVAPPVARGDEVLVGEPYSRRTGERTRISMWEKLDFGVTAFLYGAAAGTVLGDPEFEGEEDAKNYLLTVGATALAYTGLAVLYLQLAEPDRGDLPLVLGITSYLPLVVGLSAAAAGSSLETRGRASGIAGFAAVPAALAAAHFSNLDPGDAQLVRDAGFWGLVLGIPSAHAISPEAGGDRLAVVGLAGLFGGMGLGLLAATQTDVTLERVRVATWGGYAGAVAGALIGWRASSGLDDSRSVAGGLAIGAASGLAATFALAAPLDRLPATVRLAGVDVEIARPAVLDMLDAEGRPQATYGVRIAAGAF